MADLIATQSACYDYGKNFVKHSKRELVNAVLYLVKTGCQWRLLPNDFPPYVTVWSFYRRAVISGKWEQAMDISKRIKPEFEVLPMRWKVERTFGWTNHSRRLSKDFEIKTKHEENMFVISHLHTLLKRY